MESTGGKKHILKENPITAIINDIMSENKRASNCAGMWKDLTTAISCPSNFVVL